MSDGTKQEDRIQANVVFAGGGRIAMTGIVGGVALALGFPWITLAYGQALGPKLLVLFVLSGLAVGGLVALVSAFFGLVIPQQVNGGAPPWWACGGSWGEVDWKNWSEKEWKEWAEKKKAVAEGLPAKGTPGD